ncbi:MAG: glycosyltransferase family 39 protein, partial [Chloroflexota bacterium]
PPYIVGVALLVWATRGVTRRSPEASPAVAARAGRPGAAAIALLSFSALVLAVSSILVTLDARRAPSMYFDRAMVLMAAGMAAGVVGFALWLGFSWAGAGRWLRANWREVAVIAAIVVFGAFLRLYRIGEYPPPGGLAQDEGLTGASASLIALDPGFRPQPIHPISYYYIAGYAARVFGDDVLTFRLVHVVVGVALLPAFYLLARVLLGVWPALAVTFLLAVERWYVNNSRLLYNWMHVSLFEVLAALGLILGLRTRQPAYFALAGWALSEGVKGYVTFRVIIIAVVLYLVWLAIADRRALKGNLVNLGVFALTFGVFAAPYIANVIREPYWFFERHVVIQNIAADAARQNLTVPDLLWRNAQGTLSLLTQRGERWAVENLQNAPLLDPVTAALALAGVGYALVRWRREGNVLLLMLIAGTLAGGGLLSQDPIGRRIFGVFPILLLVGGQALLDAGRALAGVAWRPRLVHAASATVLGILLVGAAVSGIHTFFWGQARNPVTLM